MNPIEIERYLYVLGEELYRRDVTEEIRDAARAVVEREGLPDDWLNDGFKGFIYTEPPHRELIPSRRGDVMSYRWHRQTVAETFKRITAQSTSWVPIGDFLDDWRRSKVEDRLELVTEGIALSNDDPEIQRWAAFYAATVEWLCWNDRLPFPVWTADSQYRLSRPWQLATTPTPFRIRNIFSDDRVLLRA